MIRSLEVEEPNPGDAREFTLRGQRGRWVAAGALALTLAIGCAAVLALPGDSPRRHGGSSGGPQAQLAAESQGSACEMERDASLKSGLIGAFIPTCADDGSYAPRQAWGSTGMTWCVDPEGRSMPGTRRMPSEESQEESACSDLRAKCPLAVARELATCGAAKVVKPQCTGDGMWEPVQYNETQGSCWCVDHAGTELLATRRQMWRSEQDGQLLDQDEFREGCQDLRTKCAECSSDEQERCTEEHQRLGMNCVLGACVERHPDNAAST